MIRSEVWLRVLGVMNKETGTIWGREYRTGDGWKL